MLLNLSKADEWESVNQNLMHIYCTNSFNSVSYLLRKYTVLTHSLLFQEHGSRGTHVCISMSTLILGLMSCQI